MEFWNSAEALGRINTYLQVALVVFGIVTGVVGAASFAVGHRKSTIDARSEAQFKEQVETIDGRTAEIKALVGRKLTEDQTIQLRAALDGTSPIQVMAVRHDSKESQQFSLQIEKVFESVGWTVKHFLPGSGRRVSSPVLGVSEGNPQLEQFQLLKRAFEKVGLPFKFDEFQGNVEQQVILDVGVIPANEYQAVIDRVQ